MSTDRTKEFYDHIISQLESVPLALYIKEEVIFCLKHLHFYKLKNIKKNLDAFLDYLLFLDQQNSTKIGELDVTDKHAKEELSTPLSYFVSLEGVSEKKQKLLKEKVQANSYHLLTLMQGVKGVLLLTIDEFCNASPTRMAINAFLWEKEGKPSAKKAKVEKAK